MVQPNDQISAFVSYFVYVTISGDIQGTDPFKVLFISLLLFNVNSSCLAHPKSDNLTIPSEPTNIFAPLISL